MLIISKLRLSWRNYFAFFKATESKSIQQPRLKQAFISMRYEGSSSHDWIQRQLSDPYVKKAKEMGYRARSAFKLIEMDSKLKLFKPGQIVIECGCSPGAWTQVIVDKINSNGQVPGKPKGRAIGIDLLPSAPIPGAIFLDFSDFTKAETQKNILFFLHGNDNYSSDEQENLDNSPREPPVGRPKNSPPPPPPRLVDLVLSDMAPDATGIPDLDHVRIINLAKSVLQFTLEHGKPGSSYLAKIWNGGEVTSFVKQLESVFTKVRYVKPKASRESSAEIYIYAQNLKS